MTVMGAISAQADTWTDPDTGYTWTYTVSGNTAEIVNDWEGSISPSPSGTLTIPSTLGGYLLTSIGEDAFIGFSLESVSIPSGVTNIGDYAFAYCSLTNVVVPASVLTIGNNAFYQSDLEFVTFIGDVDDICISETAFDRTPWGEENVPFSLNLDEYGRLYGWHGRCPADLTLGAEVKSVDSVAFQNCDRLESLTFDSGIDEISVDDYAFGFCSNLTKVYIPRALESSVYVANVFNGSPVTVYYYDGDAPSFVTVSLDPAGGAVSTNAVRCVADYAIGTLPVPNKDGYVFAGWYTLVEGGDLVTAETLVNGAMALYAHWEPSPFSDMDVNYPWGLDGSGAWYCAKMPPSGWEYSYNNPGWVDIAVEGPCVVSFEWEISSEEMSLMCLCNDTLSRFDAPSYTSGEWAHCQFPVKGNGVYTIRMIPVKWGDNGNGECRMRNFSTSPIDPEWEYDLIEDEDGAIVSASITGYSLYPADGVLEIPVTITFLDDHDEECTVPVKAIGEEAFMGYPLTSVNIPESIESIGPWAFSYCENLDTVVFEGGVDSIEMNVYREFLGTPWVDTLPRPANDEFENAQALDGVAAGSVEGTLEGSTIADNDCIRAYEDAERTVWYKWVAPFTGIVEFKATDPDQNNDLLYLVGTTGYDEENEEWLGCKYCDGRSLALDVVEGETNYVSLATYNYVVSDFSLSWRQISVPANDDYANAVELSGKTGSTSGHNYIATTEGESSFTSGEKGDVWWKWTAPESGLAAFDTNGSNYDTAIAVYTGEGLDNLEMVTDDDDYHVDYTSRVEFYAVSGMTYYIAVGGYDEGEIVLSWSLAEGELIPAIDSAADADEVNATVDGVGFADGSVKSSIGGSAATYESFRIWAKNVSGGEAAVVGSPCAALSYMLGCDSLIADDITSDDVSIVSFSAVNVSSADPGAMQFSFEVEIAGVDIGSGVVDANTLIENLGRVFRVEGSTTLDGTFTSEGIGVTIGAPVDGRARLTATLPTSAGNSFFMRVNVIE